MNNKLKVNNKKVQTAIIGFGYMGVYHYNKAKETGIYEITSAFDISSEALKKAEDEGINAVEDVNEILQDQNIEFVIICTPNDTHAYYSKLALNSGKHVLVEKPVTMNEVELEEVIDCALKNERIFTVHQNRRWDEDYLAVKNIVGSGQIGEITSIESKVFGQKGVCYGWRAEPEYGGGMLYDWGIHLIDQALQMFSNEKVISVYARLQSILTPKVDDNIEIHLMFESGLIYKIYIGTFALQEQPRWMVFGDRGTMALKEFNAQNGSAKRIKGDVEGFDSVFGKKIIGPSRTMAPLRPENIEIIDLPNIEPYSNEYHKNLIAAIKGDENPLVTNTDMKRAMKIVMTAFESSDKKQVIKITI